MIKFDVHFGCISEPGLPVTIKFRHYLPEVILVGQQNSLAATMKTCVKQFQGCTECMLIIGGVPTGSEQSSYAPSELTFHGYSYTHPEDQYKKETGRLLSLGRAIEAASLSDFEARQVMVGYYSR